MTSKTNSQSPKRAVIVGASIAGLMAATAIAPHVDEVTILEKDQLPDGPDPHQGAPQGHHAHILLKAGEQAIERLFPGIREELIVQGSHYLDFGKEIAWKHHGYWKTKLQEPFFLLMQSRPFLEWMIRKRVLQLSNVRIQEETKVIGISYHDGQTQISHVEIEEKKGASSLLACDVLIDATGAASLSSKWLKQADLPSPKESRIHVDLAYASRKFVSKEPISPDHKAAVIYFGQANPTATGLVFSTEKEEVIVSLGGYGTHPPKDESAFLQYAKNLDSPEVYDLIKHLEPASPIRRYKFPYQRRKHYESLKQMPQNLLVIGDAFCRFDPIFGQGISVAAMEAVALQKLFTKNRPHNLARAFHRKAANIVRIPWLLSASEGFRMAHTTGKKPIPVGLNLLHWYLGHIFALSAHDAHIYRRFVEVFNLVKHPVFLFSPRILFRVFIRSIRQMSMKRMGKSRQARSVHPTLQA